MVFFKNDMELISNKNSTISDNNANQYNLSKFRYLINDEELKGEKTILKSEIS